MKHRNFLKLAAIPCLLVMMGCASDDTLDNGLSQKGTVPVQLTTEVEGDSSNTQTRAKLDGYTPRFVNGDNVKVWGADNTSTAITSPGYDFTAGNLNTTTNRTPLTGTIDAVHTYYYGVFPSTAAVVDASVNNNYVNGASVCVKYCSDNQIWTETEATANTANGFGNIMVGTTEANKTIIKFKNVGCLYKVTLYNYTSGTVHSVSVQATGPYSVLTPGTDGNAVPRKYMKIGNVYQYYNTSTGVATSPVTDLTGITTTGSTTMLKKDVTIAPQGNVTLYVLLPVLNTANTPCQLVFTAYDGTNATGKVLAERFNYKDASGFIALTRNKIYNWRMDCIRPFYGSANCVTISEDQPGTTWGYIDCTPYACQDETYRSRDGKALISGLTGIGSRYDTYYKPASVQEIWYDRYGAAVSTSPISGLGFTDATNTKIQFHPTAYAGNSVIAIKNSKGDIIWTYHIWGVNDNEYPRDHSYTAPDGSTRILQDRNLGAGVGDNVGVFNSGDDNYLKGVMKDKGSRGLLYQWGRNIPIPTCLSTGEEPIAQVSPVITGGWFSGSHKGNRKMGNPYYNTMYPTDCVWQSANDGEASTTTAPLKYEETWNYYDDPVAWNSTKQSIYDPCPVGYHVMVSNAFSYSEGSHFTKAYDTWGDATTAYYGMIIKPGVSGQFNFEFPVTGELISATYQDGGKNAQLWSSTYVNNGCANKITTYSASGIDVGGTNTAWALPVRCEKEGY